VATLRLRYVHSFVDKTGRPRFYFRYRGKQWPLPGQPGAREFVERYDALLASVAITTARPALTAAVVFGPRTVGGVIEKYLASTEFTSTAPGTQRIYRTALDKLKEICGTALIVDLRERHIRQIRQRFTATSAADLAVMLLRMLWSFAKENLAMELGTNPAAEVRNLHRRSWQHEPWPDWVIEKFAAEARPRPNAKLALHLLLYTGQRVSDVARMRWDDFDGDGIQVCQLKTATKLWIHCHSKLKAALADTPRASSGFILTTRFGKGYTAFGLRQMI
jgi:integrase